MIAVLGLNAHDDSNKLVSVKLSENGTVEHFLSDHENEVELLKSIIISDIRFLVFRPETAHIHDMSNLGDIHEVKWIDIFPVKVERLSNYGSTTSFCTDEASSCIGSFVIDSEDLDGIPYRSINDQELPRDDDNEGLNNWITRFKIK